MQTIEASTTTTRKPMTKSQRVRVLNDTLNAIHDSLSEALWEMIGIGNGPFEFGELAMNVECDNELRARVEAGKGSAEFLHLGRRFIEVDDLLHGPEFRRMRIKECQVHMELWEATYGGMTEAERKQRREDIDDMTPEERKADSEAWEAKVHKEVKRQERQTARASRETKAA